MFILYELPFSSSCLVELAVVMPLELSLIKPWYMARITYSCYVPAAPPSSKSLLRNNLEVRMQVAVGCPTSV